MAIGKWIGGALGWIASGGSILGALAGYCIGSMIDDAIAGSDSRSQETGDGRQEGYSSSGGFGTSSSGGFGTSSGFGPSAGYDEGSRNSFLFSMLVLASYVIKADGRVMHSEMEYVRAFLRQNFGAAAERQGEDILLKLFEEQKRQGAQLFRETIRKACVEISLQMGYSERLQLFMFLAMIAHADGHFAASERSALQEIAQVMGLSQSDMESIFAMAAQETDNGRRETGYGRRETGDGRRETGGSRREDYGSSRPSDAAQLANAYKVLGLSPTATDDEVKRAYRQMALKHHPDRVATLGEDVKRAAEQKFKEINEAKDIIYKARGM